MTIPVERSWAIQNTYEFLLDLLDPKKTPKIPRAIRIRARWCLKHYPGSYYMEQAREKAPEIFGENGYPDSDGSISYGSKPIEKSNMKEIKKIIKGLERKKK